MFSQLLNLLNNRARSLSVLTHVWLLLFMYTYPRAVSAAASSYAQDMRNYDYESVIWAIATGLLGGFARTLVSLASDKLIVDNVWKEAIKDAVVSIIAGVAALVFLEALRAVYWNDMPSPARFAIILYAGVSRLAFFGQINKFVTNIIDAWTAKLTAKLKSGAATEESAPPVDDTPKNEVQQAAAIVKAVVDSNTDGNHIRVDPAVISRMNKPRTDAVSDVENSMTKLQQQVAMAEERLSAPAELAPDIPSK